MKYFFLTNIVEIINTNNAKVHGQDLIFKSFVSVTVIKEEKQQMGLEDQHLLR